MDANRLLEDYRKGRRDFSNIRLENANLSGVNLGRIVLRNSNLSGTDFSHSDLSGADLGCCHLSRCLFLGAVLKNADFHNSDLSYASMKNAYFENTRLDSANLMWAHLCESDVAKCSIENADLTWSCLIGSSLGEEQLKKIPQGTLTTIAFERKEAAGMRTATAAYKQQEGVSGISGYGGEAEKGLYTNPQPKEKKKQEWC